MQVKRKAGPQGSSKFSKKSQSKFASTPKRLRGEAPAKKTRQEVEEEVEDVEDGGFDVNGDGGSESGDDHEVVDFYDDGEVSVNLPASKKNLFDDSDEDEGNEEDLVDMKAFSDANKNWLKSKSKSQASELDEESEEGSDEDSATIRDLERKAQKKEEKRKRIEEEAKLDLVEGYQKQIAEGEEEEESEEEEEADEEDRLGRLENLYGKIQESVGVLTEWRERRPKDGISREDFIGKLKKDLMLYFGYTEFLMDLYFNLFTPAEVLSHIEANETPRPQTIRANTLKAVRRDLAQTLINKGVTLEPIKWSKVGLVIYETKTIPIGATPEYLAGHYMLQSAASFLPVMALEPQPDEQVLDMCAAPGGKTTYIAAMMKNTGCIHANDKNEKRIPGLVANIHRMGVRNTVVTQLDGCDIPNYPTRFDRVLLDAPCMGLGVISKERGIKASKEEKDMLHCIDIQIRLLIAAIDSVDASKAAIIVYSTCSISVEENEAIVNKALERRYVKVVDSGLPFGIEGITKYRGKEFHHSLKLARRYYPHSHNIDGFFVCKLKKYADGVKTKGEPKAEPKEESKAEPKVDKKTNDKKQPKPVVQKNEKKAKPTILFDEDRPQIDQAKEEQKTQKNKAKKARKRERKLARMHGGDEGDDVDMEDMPLAKPAKPAAKPAATKPGAKTNGKTNAAPAKPTDDDVSDDEDGADMSDDVSEDEPPKSSKPKAGARPNGTAKSKQKGGAPQRRLRGSKQ